MKRLPIPLLLCVILLTSCRSEVSITDGIAVEDIGPLLQMAADGSDSRLYKAASRGEEGSWFVLSAIAEDSGFTDLSLDLKLRSAKEDDVPFGPRSLYSLIEEHPEIVDKPLKALKKLEKANGPDEMSRRARIAVLAAGGNNAELAEEMEHYRGESWEAPVLAAVLSLGGYGLEFTAILERFILHSSDPAVLAGLPLESTDLLDPGYKSLLEARIFYSRSEMESSLAAYRNWLIAVAIPEAICSLEQAPPVFAEMAQAAISADLEEEWAGFLIQSADQLYGAREYAAAYQAGRLFRNLKDYSRASSAFMAAAEAVPRGLDRDRAMWYRLRVMQEDFNLTGSEEIAAFSALFGTWENPERFDDRLEEFLHRRVQRREWTVLEQMYRSRGGEWPASARSRTAWILAFAAREGRLNGNTRVDEYLEIAADSAPLDWAGLRAAGLLNRDLTPALSVGEAPVDIPGDDDLIIRLYLRWGLLRRSADAVLENPGKYNGTTIRMTARALAEEEPRTSIRIAGLLWNLEDYHPNREDLLLRYPLPLGSTASDIAVDAGISPELFHGLIRTESAWDTRAISRSGAQGLAQFMPATWDEWVKRLDYPEDSDPMNPELNLNLAAAYLNWLYEREWTFGWTDVLASYNAGGGRIRSWRREQPGIGDDLFGMSIPLEEPRSYIRKVLSAATIYGYLYADTPPRSLHEEWGLEMLEVN